MRRSLALAFAIALGVGAPRPVVRAANATPTAIQVAANNPGATIPSTLFGVFFEDINFGADGGLYPERVKNRSFEFPEPDMGWKKGVPEGGSFEVRTDAPPSPRNEHYVRIVTSDAAHPFGILNDGFRGIGVQEGATYKFSVLARRASGSPTGLRVDVRDTSGKTIFATARVPVQDGTWKKYEASLVATKTEPRGRLQVSVEGAGAIDVDMVSLFPADTYNNRPYGLRKDLVEMLKAMHPGFLRFPGGCIVEGRYLDSRYQWKNTIGDPSERTLIINRWNDEFVNRAAPDYFQSFGLGFFEYFQLAEDIGAEPLPILNCGMACQFNSGQLAPMQQVDQYIQDALDLIEFANGDASTPWGQKRAAMGHPAPFNLKMIGVGNEQWGSDYPPRLAAFQKVLKQKYPEIKIVASADPAVDAPGFQTQWDALRHLNVDIVDEHYYRPPSWFLEHATLYDKYARNGPRLFVGEYAAYVRPPWEGFDNRQPWELALSEAAFMTGLERDADVVQMASYAPLFGHLDAWQWSTNLIWFDNLRSFGTPSYYVQQLFSANRGTRIVPVTIRGQVPANVDGLYASASLDDKASEAIVKLVNAGDGERSVSLSIPGASDGNARAVVLTGDLAAQNSLAEPTKVAPVEQSATITGGHLDRSLAPHSLTVLRVKLAPQSSR